MVQCYNIITVKERTLRKEKHYETINRTGTKDIKRS